jgi:hypothetical protein
MPSDDDLDIDRLLDDEPDRVDRAMKRMRVKGYTGEAGWKRAFAEVGPGGTERFSRDAQPSADRVERAIQHMRDKGYGGEAGWDRALAETR